MFTGIIECLGKIIDVSETGTNKSFRIQSDISSKLKVDESVSHDGVCLTIEEVNDNIYKVTAIKETLEITNLGEWDRGKTVNIERSLQLNDRIGGHIVQGHVDATAVCMHKKEQEGSTELTFRCKKKFKGLVIEKGSVCVNGVSLTAFKVRKKKFTVAVIPFTMEHTNLSSVSEGTVVNIEFDILGKYAIQLLKN